MMILPSAQGRITPKLYGAGLVDDPWNFARQLAELERLVGQPLHSGVTPWGLDPDGYAVRRASEIYALCQTACGLLPGPMALAQRVRMHALSLEVADGYPIALSLYALCAYVAESGRTSLPPFARRQAIADWYMENHLAAHPGEISPSDFKILLAVETRDKERFAALSGIEASEAVPQAVRRTNHHTGNVMLSGQHVVFTNQGNGVRYQLTGDWHEPEDEHTWSRPWSAFIAFDLVEAIGTRCLIEIDITIAHWPLELREKCIISLNSVPIKVLYKQGNAQMRLLLPGAVLLDGANVLGFHASMYAPARYGSVDHRELGVAVRRLRICLDV